MRLLSLSHRMQHRLIDNHSIFNAPAVFDYEAIVADAGGIFDSIRAAAGAEQAFESFAGAPVVNGETLDEHVGIADVLRRRLDEFTRALERGAVVAVFTHRPGIQIGVQGFQGLDRYFFLPAPAGVAWDERTVRAAEGTAVAVDRPDHPFARIIDLLRQDMLYRAYIDERAPGIAGRARIFARSGGGAAVGVEIPVLAGRVIFLPTPREAGARWLAQPLGQAMIDAIRETLRLPEEDVPSWVRKVDVPGLDELESESRLRSAALERAEAEATEARERAAERAALRDVLWASSEHVLLPAVVRCAELIGFERRDVARDDEQSDVLLGCPEGELHLVAESAVRAVGMSPHYRLRRRLDRVIEVRARAPRGLIVANGRRQQQPEERDDEIEDALRVAAEATGYAVTTSRWLFVAAVAALEGLEDETLAAIRRRLLETNGLVELADLLVPEADENGRDVEEDSGDAPPAEHGAAQGAEVPREGASDA